MMNKTLISLTLALTAALLISNTAEARRWAYVAPARIYVAPRPFARLLLPTTTTFVTPTPTLAPNVVIGPRGRLHYVAPIQPIGVGPIYVW